MTFDEFLDALPEITQDLKETDLEVLKHFMSNPAMQRVLARVALERSVLARELITSDLGTVDAQYRAGKIQGCAMGIQRALEVLFELTEESKEIKEDA